MTTISNIENENEDEVKNSPFGFGEFNEAYAQYFTGASFLKGLVNPEG